ncbi:hypothetical protein NX722_16020 [Endozoicomonas gorgoniicola]|uniref:Class I SAM-dependent methyltransferase n=1 Tax=Endozoicomonas gorgoniicola TaxID=1234144 RepID=A0ABT3MXJ3_9GAMM|nr:hypothetical protein [Endozoicomonas gorgoniicola]MCW7554097.1 hypothetical protein [Endozoicomonas gorgoniicola]
MKRVHLFEFTDIPQCPSVFRHMITDFIREVMNWSKPYKPKLALIVQVIKANRNKKIIDLCSGGGGGWHHLQKQLESEMKHPVEVILTDKFADKTISCAIEWPQNMFYHQEPVDALAVPPSLKGIRTLLNSFHHFKPYEARAILKDAVNQGQSIIIFECLRRDWLSAAFVIFMPIITLLVTPFIKPFSWKRLFYTYLIPLMPLLITWDSFVSVLRCYTVSELLEMVNAIEGSAHYEWEAGTYQFIGWHTYLVGYPK